MREISLPMTAKPRALTYTGSKSDKFSGWRKPAAHSVLYAGIMVGISGLLTICAGYFLSAGSSDITRYGAGMIYFAFPIMAIGIHALDRVQYSGR